MITHECEGCGDPTDHTVTTNNAPHSICADCEHDSMFACPDCLGIFWLIDGYRMTNAEVVCGPCAALRPKQVSGRMRELIHDGRKDSVNEARR